MGRFTTGQRATMLRLLGATGVIALLGACEDGAKFNMFQKKPDAEITTSAAERPATTRLVERDVEAPEVFQKVETALWSGTPSFGGVWVAHPDVTEPERVIIRNEQNGKFVIGSLFKRERDNPGPRIQVSSDAATALGILAGAPTKLNVTALRREEVAPEQPEDVAMVDTLAAPDKIEAKPLAPLAAAAAAIDKVDSQPSGTGTITPATTAKTEIKPLAKPAPVKAAATPAPKKPSKLEKPYVQIGIFSVQANASRTSDNLRKQGIVPTVLAQESKGKKFWRVIVGPANTSAERGAILKKVKGVGFTDAYFVTD